MTDDDTPTAALSIQELQNKLQDGQPIHAPLETLSWLKRNFPDLTIADITNYSPSGFYSYIFDFAWYAIDKQQVRDEVDEIQKRVVALGLKFADEDPYLVERGHVPATLR